MKQELDKCVLVIDEAMPRGLAANTAAILGITWGRLRPTFFAGFAVAMAGICLISFNGSALELDLRGDLLALLAAFVWACYALLSRKISALGHPTVLTTRRTFFYGLAFMLPALMVSGVRLELCLLYTSPSPRDTR